MIFSDVLFLFSKVKWLSRAVMADRLATGRRGSGDDVGRDLVFDESNAVAELQLAFLQPLQPQKIRCGRMMQRIDRRVQIAVLLLQPGQLGLQFALILVGHVIVYLKNAMRLRKAVESLWEISSLPGRFASRYRAP